MSKGRKQTNRLRKAASLSHYPEAHAVRGQTGTSTDNAVIGSVLPPLLELTRALARAAARAQVATEAPPPVEQTLTEDESAIQEHHPPRDPAC